MDSISKTYQELGYRAQELQDENFSFRAYYLTWIIFPVTALGHLSSKKFWPGFQGWYVRLKEPLWFHFIHFSGHFDNDVPLFGQRHWNNYTRKPCRLEVRWLKTGGEWVRILQKHISASRKHKITKKDFIIVKTFWVGIPTTHWVCPKPADSS